MFEDGTVVYVGIDHVAVTGVQTAKIDPSAVESAGARNDGFRLLRLAGRIHQALASPIRRPSSRRFRPTEDYKHIVRYDGDPNAPVGLVRFEDRIDRVVNSEQWVKGQESLPLSANLTEGDSSLDHKQQLLHAARRDWRGAQGSGEALALLGLGSVGWKPTASTPIPTSTSSPSSSRDRKQRFMDNLDWLAAPIAYAFQNTEDGYKVLYEDGIFAEFAVFEPRELDAIPFAPGRIIWKADEFDASLTRRACERLTNMPSNGCSARR